MGLYSENGATLLVRILDDIGRDAHELISDLNGSLGS